MYQAKSGVKNFSLYWGRGSLDKNVFSSLNMYQAKSGVKNFSLYQQGGQGRGGMGGNEAGGVWGRGRRVWGGMGGYGGPAM